MKQPNRYDQITLRYNSKKARNDRTPSHRVKDSRIFTPLARFRT
jgi:hypothetical protein